MPILIDGHNLIGRLAMHSLQDADDEEKLVRLLRSYQARTGKAITVVFDPGDQFALSRSVRFGAMEIRFAAHGSSADAVIVRRVRSSRDPQGWLVITSDQELAETVMQQGARVQSAEAFALELEPHEPSDWKDAPLSPEEVEAWLGLFEGQD